MEILLFHDQSPRTLYGRAGARTRYPWDIFKSSYNAREIDKEEEERVICKSGHVEFSVLRQSPVHFGFTYRSYK